MVSDGEVNGRGLETDKKRLYIICERPLTDNYITMGFQSNSHRGGGHLVIFVISAFNCNNRLYDQRIFVENHDLNNKSIINDSYNSWLEYLIHDYDCCDVRG